MGLVDYGSDSSSEADETPDVEKPVTKSKPTPSASNGQQESYSAVDDVFGASVVSVSGPSSLNLPSVVESNIISIAEGDLEDIVKPKEWELKLAEKEKRRREKKAKKREKKERKRKDEKKGSAEGLPVIQEKHPKGKAKISAFGALSAIADASDSDSDEDQAAKPSTVSSKPKVSGLLAMLPTPKGAGRKIDLGPSNNSKNTSLMLPPSMRNKPSSSSASTVQSSKETSAMKRPSAASDDSDDDDLPTDFFGLSSAPEPKIPRVGDIPALVNGVADVMGPTRLEKQGENVSAYGYPEVEPSSSAISSQSTEGIITDEEAHRLIMKYELAPMGIDQRTYNSAAADIVDIRVDDALGPDVHATLLKNLHTTARARDAMAPLPKSKNPADATSKRKHQITYLANLAVAREEALQQQWAESKQMRRIGRQKYGF